ncbi:MAG: GHMP kinase [Haloarculaceae archaeon]
MRARAPGSVTVVFAPVEDTSLGVSFAISDGVVAAVEDADATAVTLDGHATEFEPVEIALETLDVAADVALESEVPVGRGFGASGAATLGTVLAANEEFGLGRSRDELVGVAAQAEVEAGTGLSDVYVQEMGGFAYDTGEGRQRVARDDELRYASWGGIATGDVLGDPAAVDRVREAGHEALSAFDPEMDLPDLFDLSWEFAEATGLVTDAVRERVEGLQEGGGAATMAMVGETVVGVGGGDHLPERTWIEPEGAHVL